MKFFITGIIFTSTLVFVNIYIIYMCSKTLELVDKTSCEEVKLNSEIEFNKYLLDKVKNYD